MVKGQTHLSTEVLGVSIHPGLKGPASPSLYKAEELARKDLLYSVYLFSYCTTIQLEFPL